MKNKTGKVSKDHFKTTISYLQSLIGIVLFLAVWEVLALATGLIPTPFHTIGRLFTIWPTSINNVSMLGHVLVSLKRVLIALLFGCIVGIPLGVAMGWNPRFRAVVKPIFETLRPIPPLALVPLITLWLGGNDLSRILIVFFGVVMPIAINSNAGVDMVPLINIDVGRIFGANRRNLLFDIVLPSSLQAIFAGIRVALSAGWAVLLAAEMINARSGIGFLIMNGNNFGDIELSIVGMILLGLLGALFAVAFDYLERWLCPWLRK